MVSLFRLRSPGSLDPLEGPETPKEEINATLMQLK